MKDIPKPVRIALVGAIVAVALDYFMRPTLSQTFKV